MSDIDPYKERDLAVKEGELELKRQQFDLDRKKGPLTNVAVTVTIIGGLATALYGGLSYGISLSQQKTAALQAQKAEVDKAATTNAAEIAAAQAHDASGLALFVQYEDKLVVCDPTLDAEQSATVANAQIAMFASLYQNLAAKFQEAATAKLTTCSVEAAEKAAEKANAAKADPDEVAAAADRARYSTLTQSGPTTIGPPPGKPTVWIQYAQDAQRGPALALQKALIAKGYLVPGIQRVQAAPDHNQVRYYHDDQKMAAETLAEATVTAIGGQQPALRSLSGSYKNLPAGVVEYWFGRS